MTPKRLLKYLAVGLTILVLGAYWAFTYFFFNPFEGKYEYELSTLVPREVEFFVAQENAREDFDTFPRLAFADEFEASPFGQAWLEFESVATTVADVRASLAELEAALAQSPYDVDVLEVFGGSEVAVAGNFNGPDFAQADWILLGRASWMGKLGLEMVASGFAGVENQGLTLAEIPDGFTLSGGQLTRPLSFTRILDVLVVSTSPALVASAHEFDRNRGENSFGLSAQYANHIARLRAEMSVNERGLNVYVDQRALLEDMRFSGSWPDPRDEALGTKMAGRVFQLGTIRELVGTLRFGNGVTFDLDGKLSSELMTSLQKKLYRRRGFERSDVLEAARLAPADVGLFVQGQGPMNDLLNELAGALDPDLLELLEEPARNVWGYSDIYPLFGDISASFEDDFAFFLRDNDYPPDLSADAPPHDDAVVAVWAVVLTVDDEATLEEIRQKITSNAHAFGIAGRDPAKGGVFTNRGNAGNIVHEYHTVAVPGTGHIATMSMRGPMGKEYFVISNHKQLLDQVFVTYRQKQNGLAEDNWFQTLVNTGLPSADAVVWMNPRAVAKTSAAIANQDASLDVALGIDWGRERERIEKLVLKEHFPGETYGAVSPDKLEAFETLVQTEIDAFESKYVGDQLPALRRRYERPYRAAQLFRAVLLELSIDDKDFRLHGRLVVPFDEVGASDG